MKKSILGPLATSAVSALLASAALAERDQLMIVGSSTVYPFSTVVAERFGRSGFRNPTVESTGTGGGMKLFCKGIGTDSPDITNASRRMKKSEFESCRANGVDEVIEVLVGYDGIVIANTRKAPRLDVSLRDIYLALAKDIPDPSGKEDFIPNPHTTWSDVNPSLPNVNIRVYGPPPTSGTRDAFAELALEGGCKTFGWVRDLKKEDKSLYKVRCRSVREDGPYVEAGENDNLIIQKLVSDRNTFGIFGYSFLDQNSDKVQGAYVDSNAPEFELIASGDYPVSRPLYFYVKRAHLDAMPGLAEYVNEFLGDRAIGEDGYLVDRGLIPLSKGQREEYSLGVSSLGNISL